MNVAMKNSNVVITLSKEEAARLRTLVSIFSEDYHASTVWKKEAVFAHQVTSEIEKLEAKDVKNGQV